ncbi:MAG: hypothetical protein M5U01_25655 [Ardenticatenaceae bacterium]|nr:hypothetical protein [Ardenticatenaceae bacterium]HBY95309.1 hypothetical protein [Chloroflexota bacterium]
MDDQGTIQAVVVDMLTRFHQALKTGQIPNIERFAQEGTQAILGAKGTLAEEAIPPGVGAEPGLETAVEKGHHLPKPPAWDLRIHRRDAGRHHFGRSMGATSSQMQKIRPPSNWSSETGGLGVDLHGELTPG